jgi:hypothetical protein
MGRPTTVPFDRQTLQKSAWKGQAAYNDFLNIPSGKRLASKARQKGGGHVSRLESNSFRAYPRLRNSVKKIPKKNLDIAAARRMPQTSMERL